MRASSSPQEERTQSIEEVEALKGETARRQEDFQYKQQLQDLTTQEQSAAARLSYERLLAEKRAVDVRFDETEASARRTAHQTIELYSTE